MGLRAYQSDKEIFALVRGSAPDVTRERGRAHSIMSTMKPPVAARFVAAQSRRAAWRPTPENHSSSRSFS